MKLKAGLKKYKTDLCLLYQVNDLGTIIVIVYDDGTLEIGDKPEFMNMIEYIKKEYATQSMGEL